jgi:hypothetical protein
MPMGNRYVLDGRQECNVHINRLTTIPMPMRGVKATLRERPPKAKVYKDIVVVKSKFAAMTAIDALSGVCSLTVTCRRAGFRMH